MLMPKAFSMRRAISGDREDLAFSRSERVARRTPRISAALVTLSPRSSTISVRMKSPGWEGVMNAFMLLSGICGGGLGTGVYAGEIANLTRTIEAETAPLVRQIMPSHR